MAYKVLFLVPYPLKESPSQRFRFEQYFVLLTRHGFQYDVQSFLNSHNWQRFPKPGNLFLKLWDLAQGFFKRVVALFHSPFYDFIFVHREITPAGPPVFEWIIARVLRKKIIYDFDDAIWLTDRLNEPALLRVVKWRSKVGSICRWAYKVSCGNEYLCAYARQFSTQVVYNPTTIDTTGLHNPVLYPQVNRKPGEVNVGWTGSYTTLKYLQQLEPVLIRLREQYPQVNIVVIADQRPDFTTLPYVFIPWNGETEMTDLLTLDIGIMPLPDDQWANGKCGFKALQYMAMGIPSVASPVGVNTRIIQQAQNGFLAASDEQWLQHLAALISDPTLRTSVGAEGRKTVEQYYSVNANGSTFLSLFS